MKMYTVKQINDLYYVFETASENYIRKFKDKNEPWAARISRLDTCFHCKCINKNKLQY